MTTKKIPITPVFLDLPTVAQAATVERLEREGQFPKRRQLSGQRVGWLVREVQEWAESRPVSNLPPPPNTGAPKRKEVA
ncbi:MAG: helix-turn-helix transcriptional regulator [Afipia sp.]